MTRYRIQRCGRCHRRRWVFPTHVTRDRWENEYQHYRCSKGHTWRRIIVNLERVDRVLKRVYLPFIQRQFEQPSILMSILERA